MVGWVYSKQFPWHPRVDNCWFTALMFVSRVEPKCSFFSLSVCCDLCFLKKKILHYLNKNLLFHWVSDEPRSGFGGCSHREAKKINKIKSPGSCNDDAVVERVIQAKFPEEKQGTASKTWTALFSFFFVFFVTVVPAIWSTSCTSTAVMPTTTWQTSSLLKDHGHSWFRDSLSDV